MELDFDRMNEDATAKYLGVKKQTLALWRCTGRHGLPFTKIGRSVRYSKSDLDRWLAERTGTNTRAIAAAVSA